MYKKVLVAVDASERSVKMAEHAVQLNQAGVIGKINLVHVVLEANEEKPRWPGEYGIELVPGRPANLETRLVVESKLAPVLDVFEEAGVAVDLQVLVGEPVEVICKLAQEGDYDLVIVGSRGLNRLEGLLMDSISSRVLAAAGCPVMVLNPIPKAEPVVPENQFWEF